MTKFGTALMIFAMIPPVFINYGQTLSMMTYNIKYDNVKDAVNNWNDRREAMVELIRKSDPAFIGMQEVLLNQLQYLEDELTDYRFVGVGRVDGKTEGEYSPIFYNAGKYKLLQSDTFWLSETPEMISIGWDAAMERICTYGLFESIRTGTKVWVFNTHFDHRGVTARQESATLILKKIDQITTENVPVVLMGDFNLTPEEEPIQLIKGKLGDGFEGARSPVQGPRGTFNGFDISASIDRRIDYIFVKGLAVESYRHLDKRIENGNHISDHLPVLATFAFN